MLIICNVYGLSNECLNLCTQAVFLFGIHLNDFEIQSCATFVFFHITIIILLHIIPYWHRVIWIWFWNTSSSARFFIKILRFLFHIYLYCQNCIKILNVFIIQCIVGFRFICWWRGKWPIRSRLAVLYYFNFENVEIWS